VQLYFATVDELDGRLTEEEVDKVTDLVRRHKVRLYDTIAQRLNTTHN